MTIWKFPIPCADNELQLPIGAKILCAHPQGNSPHIWALVDPSQPTERRTIEVIGTGHEMEEAERNYIDTIQTHDGMFVWHVFELL